MTFHPFTTSLLGADCMKHFNLSVRGRVVPGAAIVTRLLHLDFSVTGKCYVFDAVVHSIYLTLTNVMSRINVVFCSKSTDFSFLHGRWR